MKDVDVPLIADRSERRARWRSWWRVLSRRSGDTAVSVGAIVGVIARFLLSDWVKRHYAGSFPLGTLIINLAGCFLIGIAQTFFLELISARRELQLLLVVGLLGGFTTFSTFSVETVRLVKAGQLIAALGYQGLSLSGGIAGVLLGIMAAHVIHRAVLGSRRRP